MTAGLLRRGWRVFIPVVTVNAVVQAATTAPFATPSFSALFIALAVISLTALIVSTVLVFAQASGPPLRVPGRLWAAASIAVVVIGASALFAPPLIVGTLTLAVIVLPGVASRDVNAGFRSFARAPLRAVALTLLTVVVLVVLWIGALLLGFLITGPLAAFLVWILFGGVGMWVICGWSALMRRSA